MSLSRLAAGLAAVTPLVSAITVPGGSNPTAGAIYLPNGDNPVTAGSQSVITWQPTTDGCGSKVDIVLLNGPSSSQMSAVSYIAQNVDNSGTYPWNVPSSLAASASDYGIETICVSTQAYQYSTRFGLKNSNQSSSPANVSTTSTSASSSTSSSSQTTETPKYPISSNTTAPVGSGTAVITTTTGSGTAAPVTPTVTRTSVTTGSGSQTTSTSTTTSTPTGGAVAHVKTGFGGLLAAAAVVIYAL